MKQLILSLMIFYFSVKNFLFQKGFCELRFSEKSNNFLHIEAKG